MANPKNKVALIGGGGIRTPLVVFGINESARTLGVEELALYDVDSERVHVIAQLSQAIVDREGGSLKVRVAPSAEDAITDARFVLSSIRAGGIASRARDERITIRHGYPGQETTGPGGMAMALRTVGASIEYGRMVERYSPNAWYINFTNPAGLITQALSDHTNAKVVGICDTPMELFHRIAGALRADPHHVHCDYLGLNHLGWVTRVLLDGKDVLKDMLSDKEALGRVYLADLFDPDLLQSLGLIPSEYLYFYYCRRKALANQRKAGVTRGEEIARMNESLIPRIAERLQSGDSSAAIGAYTDYLNQRSGSYMKLEASAGSAFDAKNKLEEDPFRAATGYHRIALNLMKALCGQESKRIVLNVRNQGAIPDFADDDIVEVPCRVSDGVIRREACGALPPEARGLALAVKAYEKATIAAVVSKSLSLARKAMLLYPPIGEWEPSAPLLKDLLEGSSALGSLNGLGDENTTRKANR